MFEFEIACKVTYFFRQKNKRNKKSSFSGACPCIVWICGGAFMVNDKSVWLPEMMDFARAGYIAASVEYRTSNDAPFPAPLMDIKAALRYLKAHAGEFCIDPGRIAVMGESAGGTLASLAGLTAGMQEYETGDYTEYSSEVQAVVDLYGLTDLTIMAEDYVFSQSVPDWTIRSFLGAETYEQNLLKASAVNCVSPSAPPFMILHGAADQVCPPENSIRLNEALKKAGVYTECYFLEGAQHGDDRFYQPEMIKMILDFLKKTIGA